jgi:uncharacterized protein (TIGR02231 family)
MKIKKITAFIFGVCFFTCSVFAQGEQLRTSSTINNVTVFINQAQVTRLAKLNLPAGESQIIFDRVSPYININSIQVKTSANVQLISVSQRNNYLLNDEKPLFIIQLEDTLAKLNYQLDLLQIKIESMKLEKEVLLANKIIGGVNGSVNVDELEDALMLFRKRNTEIGEETLKLNGQVNKLKQQRDKFKQQLDSYLTNRNSTSEVVVSVKTLATVSNASIEWSYMVNQASWTPFYDLRVRDSKSPMQLVRKAYITQGTGEDWTNVKLKLSTANPSESGVRPYLHTVFIDFNSVEVIATSKLDKRASSIKPAYETSDEGATMQNNVGIAVQEQTDINVEYTVNSAYSIPSDKSPHQVDLMVSNIPARYQYVAVPKLDKHAFVTALVSNNDLGTLVKGEAHVYFDGTYIGKTYLQQSTEDTVQISLGRDKRIQIQRIQLKDFSSKSVAGSSRKELSAWEINIRNTLKDAITILVEDQIPVSVNKEIEVKMINSGGATVDEATGKIMWNIEIPSEKSTSLRYTFEIKYPKDKPITAY